MNTTDPVFDEVIHPPLRLRLCGLLRRTEAVEFGVLTETLVMTMGFESEWSTIVCRRLDALFDSTNAGFTRSSPEQPMPGVVDDMLWEANPIRFAERYPGSGIVESYGDQWPAPCIDYWIYVDVHAGVATLSTESRPEALRCLRVRRCHS